MIAMFLAALILIEGPQSTGQYSIREAFRTTVGDWSLVAYETKLGSTAETGPEPVSTLSVHFQLNAAHWGREMWSRSWKFGQPAVVIRDMHLSVEPNRQTAVIAYIVDADLWLAAAVYEQVVVNARDINRSAMRSCIDSRLIRLTGPNNQFSRIANIKLATSNIDGQLVANASIELEDSVSKQRTARTFVLDVARSQLEWVEK